MTAPNVFRTKREYMMRSIGGLSNAWVVGSISLLFCAWIVLDNHVLHMSTGLSRSTYDFMVRHRLFAAAPDPRIVIIDIDESSLARMSKDFGRWPWSRDSLATVLAYVERQQPAAVVWDILFSDPDRSSPGGDAAFNAAVARSRHSHFSVVRLPDVNDQASRITVLDLPGLWLQPGRLSHTTIAHATVALIPPFMPAVAESSLGLTNISPDADGVVRRFNDAEILPDGSVLQTLPLSVLRSLQPGDVQPRMVAAAPSSAHAGDLIAWRKTSDGYPHASFADVFAAAEGQSPLKPVPDYKGKIVLIGATAPSLHDVHPTAVSISLSGVDTLATLIDNALNHRHIIEFPRWLQTAIALALCLGIALLPRFYNLSALDTMMVGLPVLLVGVSYLSLHTDRVFLDLNLATGWAFGFLAMMKLWFGLRQKYWCAFPHLDGQVLVLLPLYRKAGWNDGTRNRLMTILEKAAPHCRLILPTGSNAHWPEFSRLLGLIGPAGELDAAAARIHAEAVFRAVKIGQQRALGKRPDRMIAVLEGLDAWKGLLGQPVTLGGKT